MKTLKDAEPPQNTKELQSFLGMAGFSAPFISNYSQVVAPLRDLMKSDTFKWCKQHQQAFEALKQSLSSETTLAYFVANRETVVICDYSQEGISSIVAQKDPVVQKYRPVIYSSRSCTEAERKYSQIEGECLAIQWGVQKNHHFLVGTSFIIFTDHKALLSLLNKPHKKSPLRIERMRIKLSGYDFEVKHCPGRINPSDWGSRHPSGYEENNISNIEDQVNIILSVDLLPALTIEEIRIE